MKVKDMEDRTMDRVMAKAMVKARAMKPQQYVEKSYSSPISAMRSVQIKPVQSEGGYGEQKNYNIDVKDDTPIVIHFRTHANQIRVEQTRVPGMSTRLIEFKLHDRYS